jgi:hypothetical protein
MNRKWAQILFTINEGILVACKMREHGWYRCILIGLRETKNTGHIDPETVAVALSEIIPVSKLLVVVAKWKS